MQSKQLLNHAKAILEEFKAIDIVELDVIELTSITDYMLVCSARSTRHAKAIADKLVEKLKAFSIKPLSINGIQQGQWILVDFTDIVVHIMLPETRSHYDLEKLWSTAETLREAS